MTSGDGTSVGYPSELDSTTLTIGGAGASREQIAAAIKALEADKSTQVKIPLINQGNPLWDMDYHGIAKKYLALHPEYRLPNGTRKKHAPHVKNAVLHFLAEQLTNLQLIADVQNEVQEEAEPPPADDEDARKRVLSEVIRRQGQQDFRSNLLVAYSGRCAVTGYNWPDALEAAHILRYMGPKSNSVTNGLLLRADIHTLFDLKLLSIDPKARKVVLSKRLAGTLYASLSAKPITEPVLRSQRPSQAALSSHWTEFREKELAR